MNIKVMLEVFGYIGSVFVVVSLLMSSVIRLRILNLIGSTISAIYALIIRSYPLALMNICLIIINIYHLIRLGNTKKNYDLIEGTADEGYLKYLLDYYKDDITRYFPAFSISDLADPKNRIFVVCCVREVAGVLIGRPDANGLEVRLDYSTPVYRDCSVGAYLYENLSKYGIRALSCRNVSEEHISYMQKMGFKKSDDNVFVKKL